MMTLVEKKNTCFQVLFSSSPVLTILYHYLPPSVVVGNDTAFSAF